MHQQEILDAKPIEQIDVEQRIKARNKLYRNYIGGLIIFDSMAQTYYARKFFVTAEGSTYDFIELLCYIIISYLIIYSILSAIIAIIVAVFPYQNLPYNKKYSRAYHLSLLSILSIVAVCLITAQFLPEARKLFRF